MNAKSFANAVAESKDTRPRLPVGSSNVQLALFALLTCLGDTSADVDEENGLTTLRGFDEDGEVSVKVPTCALTEDFIAAWQL